MGLYQLALLLEIFKDTLGERGYVLRGRDQEITFMWRRHRGKASGFVFFLGKRGSLYSDDSAWVQVSLDADDTSAELRDKLDEAIKTLGGDSAFRCPLVFGGHLMSGSKRPG